MLTLIVALAASVITLPDPALPAPSRLRPLDAASRALLIEGADRSPTIAWLVTELGRRDVVVYISFVSGEPTAALRGSLTFVSHAASLTYVHVRIETKQAPDARLATLGHELRHALEVASAADM